MPTKTATDTSKQCSITNNSGKDIALLTIVPTGETGSSNAIPIGGGNLEVFKTADGNTVIKNGSSGSITLDHSSGEGGQIQNYDLIVSDSTWLYPVGLLAVSQQTDTSYPAQTITQDGGTAMAQAELFYQTIAAYPGSQLCQDYVAALQAARDAAEAKADGSSQSASAVATAIDNVLQSFFKGTTSYNQVTLAHLTAVDGYHKQLPFAWARYKNGFTYYLYGTDGTSSLFAGTLSLQKTGAIDVTKPNGGYTCQFVPAVNPADVSKTDVDDSKGIALTYTNNLFVNDPKDANPKIALRGDYVLDRAFTVNGDDNDVVTIVSGGVNGVSCIGLDSPQKSSTPVQPNVVAASSVSDEIVKYWAQLTHPKSMSQWVVSIMTLVSAVALIPALAFAVYGIRRVVKYKMARNEALEKNKIEEIITTVNDELTIIRIKWATSGKAVIPEYGLEKLKGAVDLEVASGLNQALAGSLAVQKYAAKELVEYSSLLDGATQANLQALVKSIQKSELTVSMCIDEKFVQDPNAIDLLPGKLQTLHDESERFSKNQTAFEGIYKKVNQALSDEARANIDGYMSSASLLFANLEKAQLEDESSKEDMDPKPEEHIVPEMV